MNESKVVPYKQKFLQKFLAKIINLFKTNKEKIDNIQVKQKISEKQELMQIYNLIKNEKITTETIDAEKLYKIMILLNEEINILDNKVTDKVSQIESQIENIK